MRDNASQLRAIESGTEFVVRGFSETSLRPVGRRDPNINSINQTILIAWLLGLLRSPAGINPLATGLRRLTDRHHFVEALQC